MVKDHLVCAVLMRPSAGKCAGILHWQQHPSPDSSTCQLNRELNKACMTGEEHFTCVYQLKSYSCAVSDQGGGQQWGPRDGGSGVGGGPGALGHHHERLAGRPRLARQLCRHRVCGRLQLRGRPGLGQGLGRHHPPQRASLDPVPGLLCPVRTLHPLTFLALSLGVIQRFATAYMRSQLLGV